MVQLQQELVVMVERVLLMEVLLIVQVAAVVLVILVLVVMAVLVAAVVLEQVLLDLIRLTDMLRERQTPVGAVVVGMYHQQRLLAVVPELLLLDMLLLDK